MGKSCVSPIVEPKIMASPFKFVISERNLTFKYSLQAFSNSS